MPGSAVKNPKEEEKKSARRVIMAMRNARRVYLSWVGVDSHFFLRYILPLLAHGMFLLVLDACKRCHAIYVHVSHP
jgi:hypothetical protein